MATIAGLVGDFFALKSNDVLIAPLFFFPLIGWIALILHSGAKRPQCFSIMPPFFLLFFPAATGVWSDCPSSDELFRRVRGGGIAMRMSSGMPNGSWYPSTPTPVHAHQHNGRTAAEASAEEYSSVDSTEEDDDDEATTPFAVSGEKPARLTRSCMQTERVNAGGETLQQAKNRVGEPRGRG